MRRCVRRTWRGGARAGACSCCRKSVDELCEGTIRVSQNAEDSVSVIVSVLDKPAIRYMSRIRSSTAR